MKQARIHMNSRWKGIGKVYVHFIDQRETRSPGSELACMLKKVAREEAVHSGISIKVVERCGVNLQSQLPMLKTPLLPLY